MVLHSKKLKQFLILHTTLYDSTAYDQNYATNLKEANKIECYLLIGLQCGILGFQLNYLMKKQPSHSSKSGHRLSNNKFKTLPNQIMTNVENSGYFFKSACEDHSPNISKLNLASPTFATEVALTSISGPVCDYEELEDKENNCLQQITNSIHVKNPQINKKKTPAKKNDYNQVHRETEDEPYNRVLHKCAELEQQNNELRESNKMMCKKLKASQKALDNKLEEALKFSQANNTSKQLSNVDIYLQLQAFRYDYKQCKKHNESLERDLKKSTNQIEELSQSMTAYIGKEQSMGKKDKQQLQKVHKKYREQIQEITNKYEDMLRENKQNYAADTEQKEEVIRKYKQDLEKVKFLKEEIEKKRHEDIQLREETINEMKALHLSHQTSERQHQFTMSKLKAQISELKRLNNEKQSKFQEILSKTDQLSILTSQIEEVKAEAASQKLSYARLNSEYTQLQKIHTKLQQSHTKISEKYSQKQNRRLSELQASNNEYRQNEKQLCAKIQILEEQVQTTESQCEQLKSKFEQWLQSTNQQRLQTERLNSLEEELSQYEKKSKELSQKNGQLKQTIQQINRSKQCLESQIQKYREEYLRTNSELQSTYRKLEEFQGEYKKYQQCQCGTNDKKTKSSYEHMIRNYNNGLSTKSISQLEMIRNTLSLILSSRDNLMSPSSSVMSQNELIISEIVQLSEQCADYFDQLVQDYEEEKQCVKTKEEIISRILKFAPEEQRKKRKILEYLRVMDNLREFSIEQVNTINVEIKQQYEQWSSRVKSWKITIQNLEEENLQMRKLLRNHNISTKNRRNDEEDRDRERDRWETRARRYIID